MNAKNALDLLARVEVIIDAGRFSALKKNVGSSWDRDKTFIATANDGVRSGSPGEMQAVLDQMRNLSQGFCSYCDDLNELDRLLGELYSEVQQLIVFYR